jgi:branched-chain amino acid transport system permease protein
LAEADLTSQLLQFTANGVAKGSTYALMAVGYTLVYGVLQLINFAHAEVYMLGSYFAYYQAKWAGYLPDDAAGKPESVPIGVALGFVAVAMVACACVGMLIERIAYRPLRNAGRLAPLITAIGVSLLLQYGGQAVFGTEPKLFPTFAETTVHELGPIKFPNTNLLIVVTSVVLMVGLTLFVKKTRPGAAMRACSHDMRTARLMGVNVNATISLTFGIGSAMAAVAGVLVAMDQPAITPLMGVQIGLNAFVAAVVGGIGSIPGAALGGLILGISESIVGGLWETSYADAVAFVFLIIVLLFRPSGILGKSMREKV